MDVSFNRPLGCTGAALALVATYLLATAPSATAQPVEVPR